MRWTICGDGPGEDTRAAAAALIEDMALRRSPSIWQSAPEGGLLGPSASLLGLRASGAVVLGLLAGAVGSAAASWWMSRSRGWPTPPRSAASTQPGARRVILIAAIAIALASAGLRVRAAVQSPRDVDEVWALPSASSIVAGDHDSWVHPPVFRALQQRWARAAHITEARPPLAMRAVSLLASIAAVLLLTALVAAQRSAWALVPLAAVSWAPGIVDDSVLARPYALASLCVVLVAALCWWPGRPAQSRGLRVFAALLAAGLAMWTDLVAGAVAGLLCASILLRKEWIPSRGRISPAIALFLSMSLWAAPLVPGALQAMRAEIHPVSAMSHDRSGAGEGSRMPDLRPRGDRLDFSPSLLTFGGTGFVPRPDHGLFLPLIGFGLLVGPALLARRTRLFPVVVVLLVSAGLLFVLSGEIALRSRNFLFLPHLAALVWILVCEERSRR
jgi:hypothetical protein